MQPSPRHWRAGSVLAAGALVLAVLPAGGLVTSATAAGSTTAVDSAAAKKPKFRPPVKGKWTIHDDPEFSGGFKVKGKGKPKIAKLTLTVLDEEGPRGVGCAPAGTTLKVKGAIKLKKGKKFAKSMNSFGHWWLIAQRDGPYDNDTYYNYMGVKPLPVKVAVGRSGTADMLVAGFWDTNMAAKKQRLFKFTLIDPAPGGGWCRYDPYMFVPAKK